MSVPPNIRGPNHCRIALGIETCIYCQSLTLFDKQLKYGVSGTEEHVFDFLSPPTCVYADSPRLTTIARNTITFPLVVVIHITASPTVLHDSPRDLNVKAISATKLICPGNCEKNNPKHYGDCHVRRVWNPLAPRGKEGRDTRKIWAVLVVYFLAPVRVVAF